MVSENGDLYPEAERIVGGGMELKEIRQGYGEALMLYNEIVPLHPQERKEPETEFPGTIDLAESRRTAKACVKVCEATEGTAEISSPNQPANAQIWCRGEPLDNLNEGLKERIERALKFGF